jgi:(p)ppGpp synthase/HD superfamily hydrolase
MSLFEKACAFATRKHAGQQRKYSPVDYIMHPIAVAKILEELGCAEHLLSAALLHDTVEDTSTTLEEIERHFGQTIAELVREPTSDKKQVQKVGKTEYLIEKLNQMSSDALTIKLADRLHNIMDLGNADLEFRRYYISHTLSLLKSLNREITPIQRKLISKINLVIQKLDF